MAAQIVIVEERVDEQDANLGTVIGEIADQAQRRGIEAQHQMPRFELFEQQPDQRTPMALALVDRRRHAPHVGQSRVDFVEDIVHRRDRRRLADPRGQPFGDVPFLCNDQMDDAGSSQTALGFPETRRKTPSDPSTTGQEGEQPRPFGRDGKLDALRLPDLSQTRAQVQRLGADLACEQEILTQQKIIVVVVERDGHAVIGEHQERRRT